MHFISRKISFAFSSAAMSAALCLAGCDRQPDNPPEAPAPNPPQDGLPQAVNFLDAAGAFVRVADPENQMYYEARHWGEEAKAHEEELMADPQNAALFRDFMSRFDGVKNAALRDKANAVNNAVNDYVTYHSDVYNYGRYEYFASAIETLKLQSGDCEDFAIFKYRVLKALGVPEERLFITEVNAEGMPGGSDHVVLIVNVADKGAAPEYVMLENGENMRRPEDSGYSFYSAFNDSGYWQYDPDATLPAAMRPVSPPLVVDTTPQYAERPADVVQPGDVEVNGQIVHAGQRAVLDNGAVVVEKDGTIIVNGGAVTVTGGGSVTINGTRISSFGR